MVQNWLAVKGRTSILRQEYEETKNFKRRGEIREKANEIAAELYPLFGDLIALHCFDVDTTLIPNSPELFLADIERGSGSLKLIMIEDVDEESEGDSNGNELKAHPPADEAQV